MKNIFGMLLGSANDRLVKSYDKTVSLINDLEPKYHAMSDEELEKFIKEHNIDFLVFFGPRKIRSM